MRQGRGTRQTANVCPLIIYTILFPTPTDIMTRTQPLRILRSPQKSSVAVSPATLHHLFALIRA